MPVNRVERGEEMQERLIEKFNMILEDFILRYTLASEIHKSNYEVGQVYEYTRNQILQLFREEVEKLRKKKVNNCCDNVCPNCSDVFDYNCCIDDILKKLEGKG